MTQTEHIGRPKKLTPEVLEHIVDLVEDGATEEEAARACGLGRRTLSRWNAMGRAWVEANPDTEPEEGTYGAYWHALTQAKRRRPRNVMRQLHEIGTKQSDYRALDAYLKHLLGRQKTEAEVQRIKAMTEQIRQKTSMLEEGGKLAGLVLIGDFLDLMPPQMRAEAMSLALEHGLTIQGGTKALSPDVDDEAKRKFCASVPGEAKGGEDG